MNQATYLHPTDQAIAAWNQLTLWILADDAGDNPPEWTGDLSTDLVHVDPRQVTTCPLCRAAMRAGDPECPNCGMELDL